jgi:lipopolysaccharide/colanic/teichoic acid biosynthesis glycosyltransferase
MIEQLEQIEFTEWPLSMGKRVFDVIVASTLLILVSPLMVLIAALIKLTSPGPVFFCAPRVGRFGETFPMLKFRSMVDGCEGPKLTSKNDGRITLIGKILRKFKLDELPQLINVLSGHMSMVGPRPHLPEVFSFEPEYEAFLHLWPGVTGAASVQFRKEEFPGIPWTELRSFYLSSVLPQKVQIELEYATRASFWSDLRLITQTAQCAFFPGAKRHASAAIELPRRAAPEPERSADTNDWAA